MNNKSQRKKRKRKEKKRVQLDIAVGPPRLTGKYTVEAEPFNPDRPTEVVMNIGLEMQQDYLRADIEIEDEAP